METSSANSAVTIFPNPASNEIHVSYVSAESQNFAVELTDIGGRIIYQDKFSTQSERTINLSAPSGIYFVRLVTQEGKTLSTKKPAVE